MKTALVTGAAGGIGFACVKMLCEAGFRVYGMDVQDEARVKERYDTCSEARYIRADLTDDASRRATVDRVIREEGHLDVLLNAAGVAPTVRTDILEMTEESYDRVMNINTKSMMFITQYAANQMIQNESVDGIRGYIVNISSMSAYTSSVSRGEYCISKAGVSMITTLFADRLAEYGIMVNEIRPGIIATPMTSGVKGKYDALIDGGLLPVARWGQPEDIAAAVLALVSGAFRYTTGQSIDVDGGFHIRRL